MHKLISLGVALITSSIILASTPLHAEVSSSIKKLIDDPLYYSRPDIYLRIDTKELSEYAMFEQKGKEFSRELREVLGLQPGFNAEQFGQAYAELNIEGLRRDLNLPPAFNETSLATALGAREASAIRKDLHLSTNFNSDEVRRAIARRRLKDAARYTPGLQYPFSYKEYATAVGQTNAKSLALTYHLPRNWNYQNLIDAAGAVEAARLRREYGFTKTASHDEIVAAIGTAKALKLIENYQLPKDFSKEELVNDSSAPDWRQDRYGYKLTPYTESELVQYLGKIELDKMAKTFGFPAQFTESEARTVLARHAIESMVFLFDVDDDFDEQDLETAYAQSYTAFFRSHYKLRPGFSAKDFESAKRNQYSPTNFSFY